MKIVVSELPNYEDDCIFFKRGDCIIDDDTICRLITNGKCPYLTMTSKQERGEKL